MPGPHPTDRNLAALIDSRLTDDVAETVRTHVRDCARCQLRLGAGSKAALLTGSQITDPIAVTIIEESADQAPETWDVWRLAWDSATVLAVVSRVDADRISALPIVDTADADDWTALLDPGITGGLGPLAVSVALETAVPWSVLSARVSRIGTAEPLVSLRTGFRSGTTTNTRRGEPVRSPLDERLVGLDEVAEIFTDLANAVWAPATAAVTASEFDFDALTGAGVAVNRALAIVRGAVPTVDEADAIEAATGVRLSGPVNDDLRRKIDQPRRKVAIRERARANRHSEATERLALAREAQPALIAARGTQGAPPDYDTILDRLLDA